MSDANRRPIFALMSANAVSQTGNQLALLALPWFVLQITGSAASVGLAGAVEGVGIIFAAVLGGGIVDRIGFRRSSILADCASGATIMLIPLLYSTIGLAFWVLLLLIFSTQLFNTPGSTARRGLLPDLADIAGMRLERANSIYEGVRNLANLGGPLLAGVLIAALAAHNVLWIDAATFAFSAFTVTLLIPEYRKIRSEISASYFVALRDGLHFIKTERVVRSITLLGTYVNMVLGALMAVILPVLARQILGSSIDFGILIAADGGGAVLGTLLFGAWGHRWPRRAMFFLTFLASFLTLALLATTPHLYIMIFLLFIDGLAFGIIAPLVSVIYQERTPVELRGRVFGSILAVHRLGVPAGVLIAGYAVQTFSITTTLSAVAVLTSLMPVVILISPSFHFIESDMTPAISVE